MEIMKYEVANFGTLTLKFKIKIIGLVPKVALIIVFFHFYSLFSSRECQGVAFCFVWLFFLSLALKNSFDSKGSLCASNFFQWIFGHMCMTTINFCQCHETYRIAFCP